VDRGTALDAGLNTSEDTMMRRLCIGSFHLACAASISACGPELPSATPPTDAAFARPTPAYTASDIGAQFEGSSQANGVNDAGEVVGGIPGPVFQAFAIIGGAATMLPGSNGDASGISNSSPRYVVGRAGSSSQPVRWTIVGSTPSEPTVLPILGDETFGTALGVNDAGAAVGWADSRAAMWSAAGERTSVPAPVGFVRGEGRDINNAGLAVFVFFDGPTEIAVARGYVRLASGQLVELPPQPGDITTYANNLSEVVDNAVYVAGTTRAGQSVFRGVRWTVNVTTGAIVATDVRPENAHALDVSNSGATAGFLDAGNSSLKTSGFLWRGSEFLSLKPPRGGNNGHAWAISPSGAFVVGDAVFRLSRHAVLWTIATP